MLHLRGRALWFTGLPDDEAHPDCHYIEDSVVSIEGLHIRSVLPHSQFIAAGGSERDTVDLRPGLILPGFIDTHIHYPQMDIIGSYGTQLLEWLENHAYPAELKHADPAYAQRQAEVFMQRLFEAGTTTALTFTTVHAHVTDALFTAAARHNARLIAGKVLMNRCAPEALTDEGTGDVENRALMERWHNHQRLSYAITPRFAIACDDASLAAAGALLAQHPDAYLHTHIAEHPTEITTTLEMFPDATNYADVYDRFGLLTDQSVFAHGIHLTDPELQRFAATDARISFCPASNLFLGSGLLNLKRVEDHGIKFGVGSDVGGGTHFSMLATLGDGYKVNQLQGHNWHPLQAFHAITRGGAVALRLQDKIGTLATGMEADLTILDPRPDSLLAQRVGAATTLTEELFAYLFLGAEHGVAATYVAGKRVYERN